MNKPPKHPWAMLTLVYFACFTSPTNMFKVVSISPSLMDWFGITTLEIGYMMTAYTIVGLLLSFPAASVIKRMGLKASMVIGVLAALAGSLWGTFAFSSTMLIASRLLEGCGIGILTVAGPSAISALFSPKKRGLPMGLFNTLFAMGMFFYYSFYALLATAFGWQAVWFFSDGFCLAALITFALLFRVAEDSPEEREGSSKPVFASLRVLMRKREIVLLSIVTFCISLAIMGGIQGFLTTYLVNEVGMALTTAGVLSSFNAAVAIAANVTSGLLTDKLHTRKWVLIVGVVILALGALTFVTTDTTALVILLVPLGIGGGFISPMIWLLVPEAAGSKELTYVGNALMSFFQNAGQAVGSSLIGLTIASIGWPFTLFGVMLPALAITLVSMLVFREPREIAG